MVDENELKRWRHGSQRDEEKRAQVQFPYIVVICKQPARVLGVTKYHSEHSLCNNFKIKIIPHHELKKKRNMVFS
jgi:hypothetical protein